MRSITDSKQYNWISGASGFHWTIRSEHLVAHIICPSRAEYSNAAGNVKRTEDLRAHTLTGSCRAVPGVIVFWAVSYHFATCRRKTESSRRHLHRARCQAPPVWDTTAVIDLSSAKLVCRYGVDCSTTLNSFRSLGEFSVIASQRSLNILLRFFHWLIFSLHISSTAFRSSGLTSVTPPRNFSSFPSICFTWTSKDPWTWLSFFNDQMDLI